MDKIAKVNFFDNNGEIQDWRDYHYFTLLEDLEVGDLVVVETQKGFKVASFAGYIASSSHAKSYIIQKVDVEKVEEEKEKTKEINELKQQILLKAEEIEERKKLDSLAESDEGMKKLLEKLDELKS